MLPNLSWDDLRRLSELASEKADDPSLPMRARDRWYVVAARLLDGHATASILREAAELATIDAALQRDAKVRQRYLDLAQRAIAASR